MTDIATNIYTDFILKGGGLNQMQSLNKAKQTINKIIMSFFLFL